MAHNLCHSSVAMVTTIVHCCGYVFTDSVPPLPQPCIKSENVLEKGVQAHEASPGHEIRRCESHCSARLLLYASSMDLSVLGLLFCLSRWAPLTGATAVAVHCKPHEMIIQPAWYAGILETLM